VGAPADVAFLAGAASRAGTVVTLRPTFHCGITWSSDPRILDGKDCGWTRTGRCGKCDEVLVDVVLSVPVGR
jgi:hypothetical protein